jgi:hypothetical protein
MGTQGTVKLYARWLNVYVNEDYTETTLEVLEGNKTVDGIYYTGSSKVGSSYKTMTDANGIPYLEWIKGTKDPAISVPAGSSNITNSATDDRCISYTIKLSKNGDAPMIPATIRMIASNDVSGAGISPTEKINLFTLSTSGALKMGDLTIDTLTAKRSPH